MVFLSGPRQAGKSTLARIIANDYPNHLVCNWDIPENRARVLEHPTFFTELARRDQSTPLITPGGSPPCSAGSGSTLSVSNRRRRRLGRRRRSRPRVVVIQPLETSWSAAPVSPRTKPSLGVELGEGDAGPVFDQFVQADSLALRQQPQPGRFGVSEFS